MRNAVYWTELPVKEFHRAKQFYDAVFETNSRKWGLDTI